MLDIHKNDVFHGYNEKKSPYIHKTGHFCGYTDKSGEMDTLMQVILLIT